MDALISGPIVLDYAFKDILVNRWQAKVSAIVLDLGVLAEALTVPDATTGYALGRIYENEPSPSCRIFRGNTIPSPDDMRLKGAPIRANTKITVRIRQAAPHRQDAYRNLSIYAHAAREVIMQYWRAYHSTGSIKAYILGINDLTDEEGSSLFAQRQIEGFENLGAGLDYNDEVCDAIFMVEHKISHPVSYTP